MDKNAEKKSYISDIEKVRIVAKEILNTRLHETPYSPAIVSHPFTDCGLVHLPGQNENELIDITSSEENFEKWKAYVASQIDNAKSAFKICCMIKKQYRIAFLSYIGDFLSKKEFTEILANSWILSEAPNQDVNVSQAELVRMFSLAEPKYLMSEAELKKYSELSDEVTVYRGITEKTKDNILAMSWTLNEETAKWFANRFGGSGQVYKAQVRKEDILAVFLTRNESEVVVDPKTLKNLSLCTAYEESMKGVMRYDW